MVALSHGQVQAFHRVYVVQEKGRRVLWPIPNPPRHRLVRTHSSSDTCPFHERYVGHVTGKVPDSQRVLTEQTNVIRVCGAQRG